jgi:hypothetical protein
VSATASLKREAVALPVIGLELLCNSEVVSNQLWLKALEGLVIDSGASYGGAGGQRGCQVLAVECSVGVGPFMLRGQHAGSGKTIIDAGLALGIVILEGGGFYFARWFHPA